MTFEEFFTKKKISLTQLQGGEPALFMEFKGHYEQMGEKSFDHTKKYWFNQLRRRFPASADARVEKLEIENPIAEQTITESLSEHATATTGFKPRFRAGASTPPKTEEPATPQQAPEAETQPTSAPATGFKPRFKAAVTKPAEEKSVEGTPAAAIKPTVEASAEVEAPKPATGFKPRFKAGVTSKPVDESKAEPVSEQAIESVAEKPTETEAAKPAVGFKPRFKAGVTNKPAEDAKVEPVADKVVEPSIEKLTDAEAPKPAVGFKPRFKAGVTKPAVDAPIEPIAEKIEEVVAEIKEPIAEDAAVEKPVEAEAPKPTVGFKPRLKAGVTKPAVETPANEEKVEEVKPAEPVAEAPVEQAPEPSSEAPAEDKPKPIGFKPRFNAAKMKPKDPEA